MNTILQAPPLRPASTPMQGVVHVAQVSNQPASLERVFAVLRRAGYVLLGCEVRPVADFWQVSLHLDGPRLDRLEALLNKLWCVRQKGGRR